MVAHEPRQLPVRLDLASAESGLGFALRALRANGIPFDRGMQWLGLERHRPVERQAVIRIAWALNVDADQWGGRMVTRDLGGKGWVRLAGQRFRRQVASNRLYAKLCPQCIRERGIARLSWLLRATVGCPWHGYSLITACQRCGQGISWDRPDIDICHCGYPFKAVSAAPPLEPPIRAWLCWLESSLCPDGLPAAALMATREMPSALTHLSVDGAFRIIEAMGLFAEPNASVRSAIAMCATLPARGSVIARGLDRLQAIEADPAVVPRFSAVVYQCALIQLANDYATQEDHALAWWLLNGLRSGIDPGLTRAGSRPRGQLPLFLT